MDARRGDFYDYEKTLNKVVTWQNLGNRLGKVLDVDVVDGGTRRSQTSDELIDRLYAWCEDQKRETESEIVGDS